MSFDRRVPLPGVRSMKLRFSLRTMMILVTCAAALCWWRDRPRRLAERFVEAVEAGRYEAADAMSSDPDDESIAQFMKRDDRNRIHAIREAQTPGEWLRGQCRVALRVHDFSGLGGDSVVTTLATTHGMEFGSVTEPAKPVQFDDPKISAEVQRVE